MRQRPVEAPQADSISAVAARVSRSGGGHSSQRNEASPSARGLISCYPTSPDQVRTVRCYGTGEVGQFSVRSNLTSGNPDRQAIVTSTIFLTAFLSGVLGAAAMAAYILFPLAKGFLR